MELERERREIQARIESLRNDKSFLPVYNSDITRILSELKNQQRINESALNMLRSRLYDEPPLIARSPYTIPRRPYMTGSYPSLVNPDLLGSRPYDNSFTADEIRIMRLNYLQNGGHDQNVLNRFTEMEYEARFRDRGDVYKTTGGGLDPIAYEMDKKINKVDYDNRRLQFEFDLLHDKYLDNSLGRGTPTSDLMRRMSDNPTLPPIYSPSNRNKYGPPVDEFDFNQYQYDDIPMTTHPNYKVEPLNVSPRIVRLKDLPPAPYDPIGGFVIFVDFITHLDPTYACARVITCLHHPKSGLGEPSVLPIVNCESYNDNGYKTSVALISTKQPVPRCPPQQALTILIELQMASKEAGNDAKLRSCAWTKIPLFDNRNRLLSGRWKTVLRMLPIRSDANLNVLESLPEFGTGELYYRLVNLRDSDEQTNAPISPSYADQYEPTMQVK